MSDAELVEEQSGLVHRSSTIDAELTRIHQKHELVSAELLLEENSKPGSPLYHHFEWDDTKAANRYRLAQAQGMIRASKMVTVISENNQIVGTIKPVRNFLPSSKGKGEYKLRAKVLSEDELRAASVDRKLRTIRNWVAETVDLQELEPLRKAIVPVLEKEGWG